MLSFLPGPKSPSNPLLPFHSILITERPLLGTKMGAGEIQMKHTILSLKGLTTCNGNVTSQLTSSRSLEMVWSISPDRRDPRTYPPYWWAWGCCQWNIATGLSTWGKPAETKQRFKA